MGHIGQRQVLFIVSDAEGEGRSHHTAKQELHYCLTHHRPQTVNREASFGLLPMRG